MGTYIFQESLGKGLIYRGCGYLHIEACSSSRYVGDKGDQKSIEAYCNMSITIHSFGTLTRKIREVVEYMWRRLKAWSKLTNFEK